jgi:hypothetical protein
MTRPVLFVIAMLALLAHPAVAQQTPPSTTFFDVPPGGILASLVTGILSALGAWRLSIRQRVKVAPDPLNVKGVAPSVKSPTCEAIHKGVDQQLKDNSDDHGNLFPRLAAVESRVAALEGVVSEIRTTNKSIDETLKIILRKLK